jgi:hypothetical protein
MMPRLRSRSLPHPARPAHPALAVMLAALPLALVPLAGCGSTSSATGGGPVVPPVATAAASSAAPSAPASAPASASPAQPATTPASPVTATPVSAGGGTSQPAAGKVYLAEGGDVNGTVLYRPACGSGCQLSGDGTTALWNMTWTTWTATTAAGTGTEKIDDCNPNCAAGTLHSVAVRVTLGKPVMVCASGKGTWYWTRVTFAWPDGLPAVFSGDNAPTNPFDYADITAQQATSCS